MFNCPYQLHKGCCAVDRDIWHEGIYCKKSFFNYSSWWHTDIKYHSDNFFFPRNTNWTREIINADMSVSATCAETFHSKLPQLSNWLFISIDPEGGLIAGPTGSDGSFDSHSPCRHIMINVRARLHSVMQNPKGRLFSEMLADHVIMFYPLFYLVSLLPPCSLFFVSLPALSLSSHSCLSRHPTLI